MIVYLDLDGVLVDWVGGAADLMGLVDVDRSRLTHWDSMGALVEEQYGLPPGKGNDMLWRTIDLEGPDFWVNLEPLAAGLVLLTELLLADVPVCFVSAPSRHPNSAAGKVQWLKENIPNEVYQGKALHRRFALCPTKHLLAHEHALLVDDRRANVDRFAEYGGHSILWPQPWSSPPNEHSYEARQIGTLANILEYVVPLPEVKK